VYAVNFCGHDHRRLAATDTITVVDTNSGPTFTFETDNA
jgi:hypothetical protein